MTNSDRLQEIRERAEKANPGPWKVESEIFPSIESADQMMRIYDEGGHSYDDALFIAASREDIPWLLQLVTEQQREIGRCRKALEAVNEFAKEDDICTHQTIGAQHGWGACFVCLIQATAQGALRGENGFFGEDE